MFVVSSLFWMGVHGQSVDPVLRSEVERDILVALYQYTEGDSWTRNEGWGNPEIHHCDWQGITCLAPDSTGRRQMTEDEWEARSVETIDLADNNLRGPVPISMLLLLPSIRSIRLNGNNVDYSQIAQQELEVLGATLDNLPRPIHSNIQRLDISHTSCQDLERVFRAGHGQTVIQTPRLQNLYASQAQIRTPFPNFLTEAAQTLERLALDHNSISGVLPPTIGNWRFMKYLSLTDNDLMGSLPETFNQMGRLRYLLLGNNRFFGTIPIGLSSTEYTPLMEQLDLSHQRSESTPPGPNVGLTGRVPAFSTQKFLRRVDLGVNSLTGTVPSELLLATENEAKTMVDFVILSSNLLTGSVPSSVLHRIPTDGLFLEDNRITTLTQCPVNEFGCRSLLCPPGTYEPRSGRQEDEDRPCLSCPQNSLYWGQTVCRLEVGGPTTPPTPAPTPAPVTVPTTPEPTVPPLPTTLPSSSPTEAPPLPSINERGVLVELFAATGGDDWTTRTGWEDPSASDFCTWHGVSCVSETVRSVKYLHLNNNNMLGNLPESIYSLPNLITLDVTHNSDLTMTFIGIENARSLEGLHISTTIVLNLDNLDRASSRLVELHMSDVGGLEGKQLPSTLFSMTNLRELTLDYNRAHGPLPAELGKLSKLIALSVANNDLSGTLPDAVSLLTDLSILRLSTNHFSGTLPVHFSKMTTLTVLDLSNQWSNGVDDDFNEIGLSGFTGPLPSLASFSQLRRLDLGVNSFHGTIPDDFLAGVDGANLFEFADISENFLTGTVPSGVSKLHDVYMQDNEITGIDDLVCSSLPADKLTFGCDAVLCAPGFYNQIGRQASADKPCQPCNKAGGAPFYGSTSCTANANAQTSAPVEAPSVGPIPTTHVRQALKLLYSSCNGADWASKNHWNDDSVHECLWDGVRCSADSHVVGISLRSNNLWGTFPSKAIFEAIPTLESLVLDGNMMTFTFEGIEMAHNLTTLDLTHTELDSVAGVELAPRLRSFYLASNNLKGHFPTELLQLSSLQRLGAAFNSLSGEIPTGLHSLTDLEFVSLHDNDFTGSIPSQLSELKKVFFLLLQSNRLTGTIPPSLGTLSNARFLDFSNQDGNGLTGPLLPFDSMRSLKRLDISQNSLTGTVPSTFLAQTDPRTFEHMDLSKNKLNGTLPTILATFPADKYDFTDNQITGLSNELCDQSLGGAVEAYGCDAVLCPPGHYNTKGRQLVDSDNCDACPENQFFGMTTCAGSDIVTTLPPLPPVEQLSDFEILRRFFDETKGSVWHRKDHWKSASVGPCEWFGVQCTTDGTDQIVQITLTANNLLGTVPAETFQLPHLKTLILDSNNCHVNMTGIGRSDTLETLDLSSTNVKNLEGIGRARVLRDLHIKSNSITGTFPDEIFQVTTLEQIDFDFNKFTGPLQHGVGQLSNLRLLSGEKNLLSGILPSELQKLTDLVTLRLGRNSFQGNIPPFLESMRSLTFIDLSHQTEYGGPGLSGRLPTFERLSGLRQLRLKSNAISGTVPYDFLKSVNADVFEYADLSSNALIGMLPDSLARLGNILLQDNLITGVPPGLCAETRGPVFAAYGCSAFLCPPETYNNHGRQESDALMCKDCPSAAFWGTIKCGSTDSTNPGTIPPAAPASNERDILIQFYQNCNGDDWNESENWMSATSFCNWQGIKCVTGSETVEAIEMGANNVGGTPPSELFTLPNLKILALYSNPLHQFSFDGIENASRLTELMLDATGLQSLAGLENAPSLELLNLRFNNLAGSVPTEIGAITTLRTISMAYNQLSGTLPTFLEDMSTLKSLLLSNNELTGNLHAVNFPASLRRLDLSSNDLSGPIPDSFLTLVPFSAELEVDLSDNALTHIPSHLTRFSTLNLYVKNNRITELDYHLCTQTNWNDGDVGRYGCDGLLCPVGEYAPNGRHSSNGACRQCHANPTPHMGASTCDDASSATTPQPQWRTTSILLVAAALAVVSML